MSVEVTDERFKEFVINYLIPFPVILKQAGLEGYRYEGKVFCPFHDNFESPAGKLFRDERGDTLFCFSEQKLYYPVDVIKRGLLKKSVETIFNRLWKQCDEGRRELLMQVYGTPVDYIPQSWKDNQEKLKLFKLGKVDFDTHLKIILSSVD